MERDGGPGFDARVVPGGYAWWYVDALSDDGRHGLTLIAFVGGVFSPYYAKARASGVADPTDHVALNVALYGAGGRRWTMTERGRHDLVRDADTLVIGPSALRWDGAGLLIDIEEVQLPWLARLTGRVRVIPEVLGREAIALDPLARHLWRPIAPRARVEVSFDRPGLDWNGQGYLDFNTGAEPLEDGFVDWTWARAAHGRGAAVTYDVHRRDGSRDAFAFLFGADGTAEPFAPPPVSRLPASPWRVARAMRGEGGAARVLATWEDTPFYARSLVETRLAGERVHAVHESLLLDRFRAPVIRALLPFRMPRRARPGDTP